MYLLNKKLSQKSTKNIVYFSLFEALVIITVVSVISTLVIPVFLRTRSIVKEANCRDSLLKLTSANITYAEDSDRFVPAAIGDLFRWHGIKKGKENSAGIDIEKGPLYPYFEGNIDICPSLDSLIDDKFPPAYERGGFGYGYNENIGSLRYVSDYDFWDYRTQKLGLKREKIKEPGDTVMFTDTVCRVDKKGDRDLNGQFAEDAFCKSLFLINKGSPLGGIAEPTIHFRHDGKTNVSWVDGHISAEKPTRSKGDWHKHNIGFFGPNDNSLFAPY